jgi:predicted TIM-barrel fold metal-dependent hydrolase
LPSADAHLHLFSNGFEGVFGTPPAGADELVAYERFRHRYGIKRGLLVGYEGEPRYSSNNDHILELARSHRWLTPLAYLPTFPAPTLHRLRILRKRGAAGFSIYVPGETEARALNEWSTAILHELNAEPSIISLNARASVLATITGAIEALDRCQILLSHLGLPGRFAEPPSLAQARECLLPITSLAGIRNVGVKFSGLYGCSDPAHDFPHLAAGPLVRVVLDTFGPARLYWGSDFSPALDFVTFAQLTDTRLLRDCATDEIAAVMGGNLDRLVTSVARAG